MPKSVQTAVPEGHYQIKVKDLPPGACRPSACEPEDILTLPLPPETDKAEPSAVPSEGGSPNE